MHPRLRPSNLVCESSPLILAPSCRERSAKSALQWMSRTERDWLMMSDNVDGDHIRVAEYIPQRDQGSILFASRRLSSS
jgi:hypothetical protein